MIDFSTIVATELPRSEPLLLELANVQIGDKMARANKKLRKRYGKPVYEGACSHSHCYTYRIDERFQTELTVYDAGEGFRDKVFGIQLVGVHNPEFDLYKGLHLGDPPSKIREVLGDYQEVPSHVLGAIRLDFGSWRYSLEMVDDALISFKINDDPNYFAD
jgi:hypothetical protein